LRTYDHEKQTYESSPIQATNYHERSLSLMRNFARAVEKAGETYLPVENLLINTESAIALVEESSYNYLAERPFPLQDPFKRTRELHNRAGSTKLSFRGTIPLTTRIIEASDHCSRTSSIHFRWWKC
jgi:hypothetical protein